jgi:probable O-glycosylation ligase (exosortase A-associated)
VRDTLLALILAYFFARSLSRPWLGVLTWTLLSTMNPHANTYSLNTQPVAATAALVVFLALLFSREGRKCRSFPLTTETVVLILFMLWMCVTQVFAFNPERGYEQWIKVMKIDFMLIMAMVILRSRQHIVALAAVLVGSIGYYGLKGGLFTLATGGAFHVLGPPGSYIAGNNEMALALVVIIPLARFLQLNVSSRWIKHGLTVLMLLSAIAAIGSQSRGALLAVGAMALLLWWRGKDKLLPAVLFIGFGIALLAFMPESWHSRMGTIATYDTDASAMGRINAWWMTWNVAKHNIFGGGYAIYDGATFARYAPVPEDNHAAHSIYFQIMGEHGFIGLFLFLWMWALVWRSAGRLRTQGRQQPQTRWLADLGAMCQVSLAGYAVGGAFLSLAYFDLPYNILILVVLGTRWMERKAWLTESTVTSPLRMVLGLRT